MRRRRVLASCLAAAILSGLSAWVTRPGSALAGYVADSVATATSSGKAVPYHVDAQGYMYLALGQTPLYCVTAGIGSGAAITAAANPTDIVVLTGSATKVVRPSIFTLSFGQTAASTATFTTGPSFSVLTRTTADTGGTAVALTPVACDSSDASAPATATAAYYTANPTLGNLGVTANVSYTGIPVLTASPLNFGFGVNSGNLAKGIVLRGTNQQMVLNLGGVAHGGLQFLFVLSWTESVD